VIHAHTTEEDCDFFPQRNTLSGQMVCPECGQENPEGFRFCGRCGASLEAPPAPAREERKVVTVLFADLVGFTARAEQMDPEDVRALLAPYHAQLRAELERYGGTVEKFIGDAVMALFGAPVAHEDDPERAVRAALAIRDWVGEGDQLQVRIAVNTGEALVALGARPNVGEGMASGDVVNTTARLQSAAPVNGILVGETTYRATRHVIDYREQEAVEAKGKVEAVAVWEAVQARSRFGVDVVQLSRAPLVGRERELAALRDALARAKHEPSTQLVTLIGVPGIGKSRLVYELMQSIRADPTRELIIWRQGRCLPYGEGVSFWALGEMVKAQAGVLESDSPEEVDAKVSWSVQGLIDGSDADWVERHLLTLLGRVDTRSSGGDARAEAFAAWRRYLEALAEQRPTVLVFEDLHWADDGLLDFVDHLVDWAGDVPLLVLGTARPELLDRRSDWGGGKRNATALSLARLGDDETSQLIAGLLGRSVLSAETQTALLERSEGNPLYAEQYVRMLEERTPDVALPETVQGIIAARLDGLPPAEKQLLQDASVLGKVFWSGAIQAIAGNHSTGVEQLLHTLDRKEFVRRERRPSIEGEQEYAFRHVLVRDVAYGQIPRAGRIDKHRRAAEWIESLGRSYDHAEMLAYHYASALELARALGEVTAELEEPARKALEDAGDRAFALNAYPNAVRFYESALELWPMVSLEHARLLFRTGRAQYIAQLGGERPLTEAARLLASLGDRETAAEAEVALYELLLRQGHRDRGDAHLMSAQKLLTDAPPSRSKAFVLVDLALSHMLAGRSVEAIEAGRQALEMAEELRLDNFRAAALNITGTARAGLGDRAGIDEIKRAAEIASEANAPYEVARAYNNLASMYFTFGELTASREAQATCIRVSERFGQTVWRRWQLVSEAGDAYSVGEWEDSLRIVEDFLAEIESGPSHYNAGQILNTRAFIRLGRGDVNGALADAQRAVEFARSAKDPQTLYSTLGASAYTFAAAGRDEAAAVLADEVVAALAAGVNFGTSLSSLPYVAWTLSLLGREGELVSALEGVPSSKWVDAARAFAAGDRRLSAEIFADMGAKAEEAYTRLRAAERLVGNGQRPEADEQLLAALAFYRSAGAIRYVREGEALLAAAS
jgi:class 3 adenylate cyclase/tetratricopeptide (TPR) repeat protein